MGAYLAVRTASSPLSRAEVADEVGNLGEAGRLPFGDAPVWGFLEATYERDERSVVVGHPAKRYRPTGLELKVWIPPRRYDLAAEILAEALDKGSSDLPQELLADVAAAYGREVGMRARARSGDSGDRLLAPASTP